MDQSSNQLDNSIDGVGSNQVGIDVKSGKKTKVTIYLTEEAEHAFAELYIHRYRTDRKIDRSTIACEAIQILFEKEIGLS